MSTLRLVCIGALALLGCSSSSNPQDAAVAQDVAAQDVAVTHDAAHDATAPADAAPNPCEGLGGLCHEVDPGDGPIHDCHEGGHDGDPTWCAANGARCRALCLAAADGGVHEHDAATDAAAHDHDAATDAAAHDHDAAAHDHDAAAHD
ncbi:MAG: hypothetical protein R3A48_19230 [Polyangiales bacterium]